MNNDQIHLTLDKKNARLVAAALVVVRQIVNDEVIIALAPVMFSEKTLNSITAFVALLTGEKTMGDVHNLGPDEFARRSIEAEDALNELSKTILRQTDPHLTTEAFNRG
jgi:hypothetical protein